MTEEIWKDIEGYEGKYQVSNLGNIRSLNYNHTKIRKLYIDENGYKKITLSKNCKLKTLKVHRLVAQAFISNHNNYTEVNHIDENPSNNCVENLEWCTRSYNVNYGKRTDKQKKYLCKSINQYSKDGEFIKRWDCIRDIERELGYSHQNISMCANGKYKSSHGFIWRYKEEKAA